jgi:hypothetical protein
MRKIIFGVMLIALLKTYHVIINSSTSVISAHGY